MKYIIFNIRTLLYSAMLLLSWSGMSQTNSMMASVNASGNLATGNAGSVSYSIGQVFYTYEGDQEQSVAQGVQQAATTEQGEDLPEDIDTESPEISVLIYPNPATEFVTIATQGVGFQNDSSSYQLFNYQGKLIMQNSMHQDHTTIQINNLSSSIYILRVYVQNKLFKTFKIIKK